MTTRVIAARPTLERVEVLAEDVTSFGGVIDDRGHPLVVLSQRSGELWRVTAPRDREASWERRLCLRLLESVAA